MGKAAKGSRKGKKAWRANISTADIEDYLEKATRHDVSSLEQLPDASLFQVQEPTSTNKTNNKKRKKTELHREKPLRHEAPLQKNPFLRPIPSSKLHPHPHPQPPNATIADPPHDSKVVSDSDSDLNLDIWDAGIEEQQSLKKKRKHKPPPPPAPVPAVEIDPLGCSFNPPFEAHQDALAKAVADEMQKLYRKELQPDPVPLTVAGELIPEEDKFFLDADDANDSSDDHIHTDQGQDPPPPSLRQSKTKKVTRVQLNRRARRKELLRAEAQANKIQTLSKQIDSIPGIMKEIEKEDEEKERKHTRRLVAKQDRLKNAPPRLGKSKYVPPPVQVLLTEEITGSLRKLKGCCTLATDRFKSLQKRALIVPRSNKRSRN